jgi:hypothetical protein
VPSDIDRFYRIIGELDRLLTPGIGEGFWSARPLFAEMDQPFLNGWVACRLKELRNEQNFLVFRDRNALTINVTKAYAVSLATIDHPADGLYLYPQHYMARNVGHAPLKVRRYRSDRPVRNEIYDPSARLELRDEFALLPGETLERNGYEDVLDWQSEGTPGFLLRLHSESLGDYEWAFDRTTLAPKGVTVLDSFSSQITTVMQMLTTLGTPVYGDFVETALGSRYFHVRWEALKMINQLTPERTQAAIERLKNDPHPAIRRAVERTLQLNLAERTGG